MDDQYARAHVRIRGLCKTFTLHVLHGKRIQSLRDVSFDVPSGGVTAVVGSSGSGKSTLLKCLHRTYLPTSGELLLQTERGAVDLALADDHLVLALRRQELCYVPQFLRAPPRVPALDVVARPLVALGTSLSEARDRAANVLAQLGLARELFDAYPSLFSGGEQQRVNIARALIVRSRLLLLDEPTSALDHDNLRLVVELLRQARAAGTTIVGIFHDANVVRELADVVVTMNQGAVRSVRS
jgi:alpha-D-ribose 1-methylphosphonate 5-triphosphate synthase subunit PhnL